MVSSKPRAGGGGGGATGPGVSVGATDGADSISGGSGGGDEGKSRQFMQTGLHSNRANFTGVDSPYERPEAPDLHIQTASETLDPAVDRIIARLRADGVIG